jgi:hypothetical protein
MKKLLATVVLFGSIWGLFECSMGDLLHDHDLSVIMASLAIFIMSVTRIKYGQPGMQLGMALVAGLLRHFNPVGTCLICSSIAIMIEGLAFEIIWAFPWKKYNTFPMKVGVGIISFYSIYALGYLATQILTPYVTATFFLSDLVGVLPRILFHASIAGVIGLMSLPIAFWVSSQSISFNDKFYYPVAISLIAMCWVAVISGI